MSNEKDKLINRILDKRSKKPHGYGMTRQSLSKKSTCELRRINKYL